MFKANSHVVQKHGHGLHVWIEGEDATLCGVAITEGFHYVKDRHAACHECRREVERRSVVHVTDDPSYAGYWYER